MGRSSPRRLLAVRRLWTPQAEIETGLARATILPEGFRELLEFSILASEIEPFDPMERAFLDLGRRGLTDLQHQHPGWQLVHEYAFAPELPAHTHVWQPPGQTH